jgi:hypothetical protein
VASATGAPLRLIGAASDDGADGRDASRLLADASLLVQRLGAIRERLASAPPAPTVLVRRGAARPGLAPDDPRTRFRWSLTGAGS